MDTEQVSPIASRLVHRGAVWGRSRWGRERRGPPGVRIERTALAWGRGAVVAGTPVCWPIRYDFAAPFLFRHRIPSTCGLTITQEIVAGAPECGSHPLDVRARDALW